MTAFLIADVRVINRDKYDEYRRLFRACVARHGGVFVARGQEPEVVQGGWHPPRMMIIQFASMPVALAMLASDEYKALEASRGNCAMFDIVLVEGRGPSRFAGVETAPAYAVADTRIINRGAFEAFSQRIDAAVRGRGGRYLVVSDAVRTVAGNWAPPFLSLIEFPSRGAARSAYVDSGYDAARDEANNAAMIDMVLLSGESADEPA